MKYFLSFEFKSNKIDTTQLAKCSSYNNMSDRNLNDHNELSLRGVATLGEIGEFPPVVEEKVKKLPLKMH